MHFIHNYPAAFKHLIVHTSRASINSQPAIRRYRRRTIYETFISVSSGSACGSQQIHQNAFRVIAQILFRIVFVIASDFFFLIS